MSGQEPILAESLVVHAFHEISFPSLPASPLSTAGVMLKICETNEVIDAIHVWYGTAAGDATNLRFYRVNQGQAITDGTQITEPLDVEQAAGVWYPVDVLRNVFGGASENVMPAGTGLGVAFDDDTLPAANVSVTVRYRKLTG